MFVHFWVAAGLVLAGAGAAPAKDGPETRPQTDEKAEVERTPPTYLGIETMMLDEELVRFRLALKGTDDPREIEHYAQCAAAQYALIRGYGFARHIRTLANKSGPKWQADAIYTISAALPRGEKTIDAEITVRGCAEQGIPTI